MQDPSPVESKCYVLVRDDLPPGLQVAQAVHAAVALTLRNPEQARLTPNTIVLSARDEDHLFERILGFDNGVLFREPDLDGEATAFACFSTGREFSDLPLAGRAMVT